MNPLVMIVEDEPPLAELLSYNLDKAGYRTVIANTGEEAIGLIEMELPELAVIDWMLPERSGVEVCRILRNKEETRNLPIIMLTARGEEGDRVIGLEAGADDYVVKPYSPKEVIARINALLRRSRTNGNASIKEYGGIKIDLDSHRVTRDGHLIHLSPKCFRLLETLIDRPTYVFSRDSLLGKVWGGDVYVEERTVDVHIRRLRKALNVNDGPGLVRTVRGAGYSLDITPNIM
jgi:two-component system, OmpR family, phosphate regulon response regulator PhoB